MKKLLFLLSIPVLNAACYSQGRKPGPDTTSHKVQFIEVQRGIKLESLDFGGTGRPIVFLAGGGEDAHDWDQFAPKFVPKYHVYAITRRGFGNSDKPEPTDENYDGDRLGDDVLAVMTALKLDRPILVGFSAGGEELSSIGSRFPDKVAGLVYLDGGYSYAFYGAKTGDPLLDRAELRRLLRQAEGEEPLSTDLKRKLLASLQQNQQELSKSLEHDEKAAKQAPSAGKSAAPIPPRPPMPPQISAMRNNGVKYTKIAVPIRAIYAVPTDLSMIYKDPEVRAKEEARDAVFRNASADAFQAGLPSARVVRIAHARQDVFASNEDQVMMEMSAFIMNLP